MLRTTLPRSTCSPSKLSDSPSSVRFSTLQMRCGLFVENSFAAVVTFARNGCFTVVGALPSAGVNVEMTVPSAVRL